MYGDQVNVIGVAGRAELPAINDFITNLNVSGFEHAIDEDGSVWSGYGVTTQPAFAFINDDGEVTTHIGGLGVEGLQEQIDTLLAG